MINFDTFVGFMCVCTYKIVLLWMRICVPCKGSYVLKPIEFVYNASLKSYVQLVFYLSLVKMLVL